MWARTCAVSTTIPVCEGDRGAASIQMTGDWLSRCQRVAVECLLGGIVLAALTLVCFQFGLGLATTGFIFLTTLVLLSLRGRFTSSVILSAVAVASLTYFFARPIVYDFKASIARDIALVITFPVT